MSVTPDSPAHPWSSDAGQLNYKGSVVGMMYLGGDSLIPNPRLADVIAMRLNHYEEVNPGRLAVELDDVAGVTTTRFARGPEDTGQFEWEAEGERGGWEGKEGPITPPRAAPPGHHHTLAEGLVNHAELQAMLDAGTRRAAEAPEEVKQAFREAFPPTHE